MAEVVNDDEVRYEFTQERKSVTDFGQGEKIIDELWA